MEELYNLGITENTIKSMIDFNPDINEMSNDEIVKKIQLLLNINCTNNQIINILTSNARYFNRTITEIITLFKYLMTLGFEQINILLDANPYILNLEPYEINNYINKMKNNDKSLEDIIDELEANPYLFNEI